MPLFEQSCCNAVTHPETLERILPWQLEMSRAQTMTGCKSTLPRKVRRRVKANTTNKKETARPARPTRALQTSTRARTVAELDMERRTSGDQVGQQQRAERQGSQSQERQRERQARRLWKRISLLEQLQQCRILHKHRVQLENSRAFHTWNRGSWV